MRKMIGFIMVAVGALGSFVLLYMFYFVPLLDPSSTKGAPFALSEIRMDAEHFMVLYLILCFLMLFYSGAMKLNEKQNKVLDWILFVMTCFGLVLLLLV
jgi:hypothetical protein